MKWEIDLAREQHAFFAIPVRERPNEPPVKAEEIVARRRSIRMVTDALIERGMMKGDIHALFQALCEVMVAVPGTCAQFGLTPTIDDFLLGAKELTELAREQLDRSVLIRDEEQIVVNCAMLQCIVAGVCAILGLPYREGMEMAHKKYLAAESPSHEDWVALLHAHGFKDGEAANDDNQPTEAA